MKHTDYRLKAVEKNSLALKVTSLPKRDNAGIQLLDSQTSGSRRGENTGAKQIIREGRKAVTFVLWNSKTSQQHRNVNWTKAVKLHEENSCTSTVPECSQLFKAGPKKILATKYRQVEHALQKFWELVSTHVDKSITVHPSIAFSGFPFRAWFMATAFALDTDNTDLSTWKFCGRYRARQCRPPQYAVWEQLSQRTSRCFIVHVLVHSTKFIWEAFHFHMVYQMHFFSLRNKIIIISTSTLDFSRSPSLNGPNLHKLKSVRETPALLSMETYL